MNVKKLLKTYYPALLILIALVSFTLFAFFQSRTSAENRRLRLFELRVQQATEAVEKRLTDYIQILKGCQSLFYASQDLSYPEWNAYVENLRVEENYPGIQALAYAAYIPADHVENLEREVRSFGFPQFKVKSTFKNSDLSPIIFITPLNQMNERAFGYDMYSEPNRKEAMDRAMRTGKPAMTKTNVTLVQESNKNVQPGFLLYLPVYEKAQDTNNPEDRLTRVRGFVYNAFRAHDLMGAILKDFTDIEISLYASQDTDPKHLLYHSKPRETKDYSAESAINIAGTSWKMVVFSGETFGSSIEKRQPFLILIFGLAISSLLFAFAVNIIRHRLEIAEELNLSKRLEKKKDEFIGIASHELKTPLTSIKAYIQLLERSNLGARERTFVSKATSNIAKLNSLIGDLLDVSKIQAGRLQFNIAPFPLNEMINESVENVQHMVSSHKILKPKVIPDIIINGDKLRLEQALTNFLVNAVKYSPEGKSIHVNTEVSNGQVKVEVVDEGIGISEEYQQQIFDRFYRVDSLSPVISGLGVGLYITREIIRRHNGHIGLNSELGKGSTFYFWIPIAGPPARH